MSNTMTEVPDVDTKPSPPQEQSTDPAQIAINILKRTPSTLEDINEMRASVYENSDAWKKFEKYVCETMDDKKGDKYELKHSLGLAILGKYEQAEEELRNQENIPIVGCLLARICLETGREEEAVSILKKICKRVPEVVEYHSLLCEALDAKGNRNDFLKEIDKLEQRLPDHADILYFKGRSQELNGEYEKAKKLYAGALEKNPDHMASLFRIGYRADIENDDETAIEYYTRAMKAGTPNIAALMNLGILYEDNEDYENAVKCFESAQQIYPGDFRVEKYLRDAKASIEMYYDEEKERKEDKQSQVLNIPVSDFELSVRSRNCLAKMNIQTLGDLISRTEAELLAFKNFGETSLMEIKEILASKGLRLGMMSTDTDELPTIPDESTDAKVNKHMEKSIEELDLSIRSKNCILALNIKTVGQLVNTPELTLLSQKNFGQTSLNEIRKKLGDIGLALKL